MQSVPEEQIHRRLAAENPWWADPSTINAIYDRFRPRAYFNPFQQLIKRAVRRAILLMGPRRVGKTVMMHHSIRDLIESGIDPTTIAYVSVDHPIYNGLGLEQLLDHIGRASGGDPRGAKSYVFFDEVQYLRQWEIHLKTLVDSYPQAKFVASGSAAAALRLQSSESGAGRFTDFLLPPLTFHEYLDLTGALDLVEIGGGDLDDAKAHDIDQVNAQFLNYLNYGGYPEALFSPEVQSDLGRFIKSDIIDKVLLRDLPSLYGIQDIQELNYLFTTLAYNTANEVSLEELSQNSGVAKNTLKRYIEYLEAAFLLKVVHRIDRGAQRFRRATCFKTYLTNPSIRSALFSPVGPDDAAMGQLAETAIFSQWFHANYPLQYARWKGGEVDLVYLDSEEQKPSWAIEVKWSDRYVEHPHELKSLIDFCRTHELDSAVVTTRSVSANVKCEKLDLHFIPASLYCFTVGYNVVRAMHLMRGHSRASA